MEVYYGFEHKFERAVVAVGSFDGVHKGHQLLIKQMNQKAKEIHGQAVVVTFDPHPRTVLRGENRLLSTLGEKLWLLEQAGAQNVVVINFTLLFSQIEPEVFVQHYLIDSLSAVAVFTGQGHSFGHNRGGDEHFLTQFDIESLHIDRFENISSTAVRTAIDSGNMQLATQLLGHPYLIITPVTQPFKLFPPAGQYLCNTPSEEIVIDIENIKKIEQKCFLQIKESLGSQKN